MAVSENKMVTLRLVGDHTNCPLCNPPAAAAIDPDRARQLTLWADNKGINPTTGAKIHIGGPTYKALEKEFTQMQELTDPAAMARRDADEIATCRHISKLQSMWAAAFVVIVSVLDWTKSIECARCGGVVIAKIARSACMACTGCGSHCQCETAITVKCSGCSTDSYCKRYPAFDTDCAEFITFLEKTHDTRFAHIPVELVAATPPAVALRVSTPPAVALRVSGPTTVSRRT